MQTVPVITPNAINGMTGLKERPVYFLKLNGAQQPNLVVKGEAAGGQLRNINDADAVVSVAWGSKLMKNVQNSLVNTKIMTPAEVQAFKTAAQHAFAADTPQYRNALGAIAYNWVKMPFVANLSDAQITEEKQIAGFKGQKYVGFVGSVPMIKQAIQKLSSDAVWLELGKVVAVDIFNGNGDRFNIQTGAWQNYGNVMFLNGGQTPVIGLDTFDPNGGDQSNLNKRGTFEELLILTDSARRKKFAGLCTKSVGTTMKNELKGVSALKLKVQGPNGPDIVDLPVASLPSVFDDYASDFEQGLAQGAISLKMYLQGKLRQYGFRPAAPAPLRMAPPQRNFFGAQRPVVAAAPVRPGAAAPQKTIPQGIIDRMTYLGWML
jgi:hypothetical protein